MRIRMKETRRGSPDGRFVYDYVAGETYDGATTPQMSDDLAAVFVREGWAVEAGTLAPAKRSRKVTGPAETKEDEADNA